MTDWFQFVPTKYSAAYHRYYFSILCKYYPLQRVARELGLYLTIQHHSHHRTTFVPESEIKYVTVSKERTESEIVSYYSNLSFN